MIAAIIRRVSTPTDSRCPTLKWRQTRVAMTWPRPAALVRASIGNCNQWVRRIRRTSQFVHGMLTTICNVAAWPGLATLRHSHPSSDWLPAHRMLLTLERAKCRPSVYFLGVHRHILCLDHRLRLLLARYRETCASRSPIVTRIGFCRHGATQLRDSCQRCPVCWAQAHGVHCCEATGAAAVIR